MTTTWRPYFLEVPVAIPLEIELALLDDAVGGACTLRTHMIETLLKIKRKHGDQAFFRMSHSGLGFFLEDVTDYLAIRKLSHINKAMREKMRTLEYMWLTHALNKRRHMNLTQFETFVASPSPTISALSLVIIDGKLPAGLEILKEIGLTEPTTSDEECELSYVRDKFEPLLFTPWLKSILKMPPTVRFVEIVNMPYLPMRSPESGMTSKIAVRIAAKTRNSCIVKFAETNDGSHSVSLLPPWKIKQDSIHGNRSQDHERNRHKHGLLMLQARRSRDRFAKRALTLRLAHKKKLKALKT